MKARRRQLAAMLVICMAIVAFTGARVQTAEAVTPEEAISLVDQQRAAYGIPPLTLDQSLAKPECDLEDHEIASPFPEQWSSTSNPWDNAPYHLAILMDPERVAASYSVYPTFGGEQQLGAQGRSWACMWFSRERNETKPVTFYWASEATGPNAIPPSVSANEYPYTPAQKAGLPNPTGPNLIVYAPLPGPTWTVRATAAAVQTAAGVVVPSHLLDQDGDSAVVLVDSPVQPLSSYQVSVDWEVEEPQTMEHSVVTPRTQTFSFATSAIKPANAMTETHSSEKNGRTKETSQRIIRQVQLHLRTHGSTLEVAGPRALRGHQVRILISREWVPCAINLSAKRCTFVSKGHPVTIKARLTKGIHVRIEPPGDWEKLTISIRTKPFEHGRLSYLAGFASILLKGPKSRHR